MQIIIDIGLLYVALIGCLVADPWPNPASPHKRYQKIILRASSIIGLVGLSLLLTIFVIAFVQS